MPDLYPIMKGKAYRLAQVIIAPKQQGEDLLKTIMKDSDAPCQALFLIMLRQHMPAEAHQLILLNGMAKEYAGLEDWNAYVERECGPAKPWPLGQDEDSHAGTNSPSIP